jgi:hypothetical protein
LAAQGKWLRDWRYQRLPTASIMDTVRSRPIEPSQMHLAQSGVFANKMTRRAKYKKARQLLLIQRGPLWQDRPGVAQPDHRTPLLSHSENELRPLFSPGAKRN